MLSTWRGDTNTSAVSAGIVSVPDLVDEPHDATPSSIVATAATERNLIFIQAFYDVGKFRGTL